MAANFIFKVDEKRLVKATNKFPKLFLKNSSQEFTDFKNFFHGNLTKERLSGRPGLNRRTHALVSGFFGTVLGNTLNTLRIIFGFDVPYAAIHETGGTITGNPWLAIPLGAMRQGNQGPGVSRIREVAGQPKTFFKKSKKGNLILFRALGGGRLEPLFVLKRSVRIPARLKFFATFERDKSFLRKGMREVIRRTLKNL